MSVIMKCPRCGIECNTPSQRLITDNCGHCKCRQCLLKDEAECLECKQAQTMQIVVDTHDLISAENSLNTNEVSIAQASAEADQTTKKNAQSEQNELLVEQAVEAEDNAKQRTASNWPSYIQKTELPNGKQQFLCTLCEKRFMSRSQKYYHLGCGNEDAKKYKCTQCEKSFVTRSHLNYHTESHALKSYHCTQCPKIFGNQMVLKKHQRLHVTTPVRCTECGKQFRCKKSLSDHLDWHRNNLRYECTKCEKKYAVKSVLKQHMLKHFDKKHKCKYCGKGFQRNTTLTLHMKRHTKTESFVCAICYRNFSDSSALLRHNKMHEESIKYKCKQCDISSQRKDNMLRHVRNMHVDQTFEQCVEMMTVAPTATITSSETNLPKTIANSSVIKCIGNVKPVLVLSLPGENKTTTTATTSLAKPDIIKTKPSPAEAPIEQKKSKNNVYDPIEMYRKILISEDDPPAESVSMEKKSTEDIPAQVAGNSVERPTEHQQRANGNTSNFSEMHWRKNFKYTYEYREY